AQYYAGEAWACPPEQALSQDECKLAGDVVGYEYAKVIYAGYKPTGCFWQTDKKAYWNRKHGAVADRPFKGRMGAICKAASDQ
ncbi:unnamed protein product, partial [Polarella glacialis]